MEKSEAKERTIVDAIDDLTVVLENIEEILEEIRRILEYKFGEVKDP